MTLRRVVRKVRQAVSAHRRAAHALVRFNLLHKHFVRPPSRYLGMAVTNPHFNYADVAKHARYIGRRTAHLDILVHRALTGHATLKRRALLGAGTLASGAIVAGVHRYRKQHGRRKVQ
jgi:hypothetical protein